MISQNYELLQWFVKQSAKVWLWLTKYFQKSCQNPWNCWIHRIFGKHHILLPLSPKSHTQLNHPTPINMCYVDCWDSLQM